MRELAIGFVELLGAILTLVTFAISISMLAQAL
jgi:hypothetical protein